MISKEENKREVSKAKEPTDHHHHHHQSLEIRVHIFFIIEATDLTSMDVSEGKSHKDK